MELRDYLIKTSAKLHCLNVALYYDDQEFEKWIVLDYDYSDIPKKYEFNEYDYRNPFEDALNKFEELSNEFC
jgi:hypothetical protein